jgi:hypothetical protein
MLAPDPSVPANEPLNRHVLRKVLLDRCLQSAVREYSECCDNWKLIEGKAQATAGACGVFVVGLFAAVARNDVSPISASFVVIAVGLLLVAFGLAVSSLRVSDYWAPHDLGPSLALARAIETRDLTCTEQGEAEWLQNELEGFTTAIKSVESAYSEKLWSLRWSHVFLVCAVLVIGFVSIIRAKLN